MARPHASIPAAVTLAVRAVILLAVFSMTAAVPACGSSSGAQLNQQCSTTTPCESGLACGYAITAGCTSTGICVPEVPLKGQAQCQGAAVACACGGGVVAYGCFFYSGYAPAPVDLMLPLSECLPTSGGTADGGGLAMPDGAADGAPVLPADSGG
jgi:hypothetical protein